MAYQVLARKWRPRRFADLVGQEHVIRALVNALDNGRLHHAYMLTGSRGVGKTTIARILAKSLNCPDVQNGEPCCVCESCLQIDAGRHVDVMEIDAASNTGIDNIREVLENARYAPTMGKYKVYIIDEVHMLSKSAFNAMLKTLEEPPEHVKFILATTDPQKVPITVLSRCLQFVLRNLTTVQIAGRLSEVFDKENIAFEPAAVQLLARAASGSMRDALSLSDQAVAMGGGSVREQDVRDMTGSADSGSLYRLLEALAAADGTRLMGMAAEMAKNSAGFAEVLNALALLLQRLALIRSVPEALSADEPDREALKRLADIFGDEQLQLYYQCVLRGKADLPLAPDEYAGFVMTLLRMLAFAPLAAPAGGGGTVVEGSGLHDPQSPGAGFGSGISSQKVETPVQPTFAEYVVLTEEPPGHFAREEVGLHDMPVEKEPLIEVMPVVSAESEPEAVYQKEPESGFVPDSEVLPDAEADFCSDIPPWEDEVSEVHDAVAESETEQSADPSVALMPADHLAEHDVSTDSAEAKDQDEKQGQTGETAQEPAPAVPEQSENVPELLSLTAENWPSVLQSLSAQLGATLMFVRHTAIRSFDRESGRLLLEISVEAARTADQEGLTRLGRVLSAAYGFRVAVEGVAMADESVLETPQMQNDKAREAYRDAVEAVLERDDAVQMAIDLFSASWVRDSLKMKE